MVHLPQPGLPFTLLTFLAVLGVLVFIHEWGHYFAGRLFKVRIETFSIGFGRELFGWTDKRGCRWKISALPFGGYVKFYGDSNAASMPSAEAIASMTPEERAGAFPLKPLWQRAIIVAAGPAINFLFAILIFAGFFMTIGQQFTPARVEAVMAGSPAEKAGFMAGDLITRINGDAVSRFEDVAHEVAIYAGRTLVFEVERTGRPVTLTVVPEQVTDQDEFGNAYQRGRIGLQGSMPELVRRGPVEAFYYAGQATVDLVKMMASTLGEIVTGDRSVKELGGPVKIAQYSAQSAALGVLSLISFMALVSLNLGFVNLLPVPMLDGGHLFLYAIEAVRGRPVSQRVQEWAFLAGFALVISLMLFLTWNDLGSYGIWDRLSGALS
ncbi:RIP metalloprotease RseP [Parapedomonas caeni]